MYRQFLQAFILPFVVTLLVAGTVMAQIPTKCLEIESVLVDACNNSCPGAQEGTNEMFRFITGPTPIPLSQLGAQWATPNSFLGWVQDGTTASITAQLNATITACGYLIEPPNGIIPPGKRVLGIVSTEVCVQGNSFALLSDTLYIIFQTPGNFLGHFKNTNNGAAISTTPSGSTSFRTFILSVGACADTATYNISQMVNIYGSYGGSSPENDGSSFALSWPGVPVASYYNNGCQAPINPFSAAVAEPAIQAPCGSSISLEAYANGNVVSVQWSGGAGTFDQPASYTTNYTLAPADVNGVVLTFCAVNACGDTACAFVQVDVTTVSAPIVQVDPAPIACGGSTTLQATATGATSYYWQGGSGVFNTSTALSTIYTPSAAESGTIDLGFCAIGGCGDTICAAFQVVVDGPPVINITASGATAICAGTSVMLTANGGGTYMWSNGAGTASTTVSAAGTYAVTSSNVCGSGTDSISITVTPLPIAVVSGPPETCAGTAIELYAQGGNAQVWNTGATGDTVQVVGPGTYTVTVTDACGSNEATIVVASGSALMPSFAMDTVSGCAPLCVAFTAADLGDVTYTWTFGDGGSSEGATTSHCFNAGDHDVSLTVAEVGNVNGCPGTVTVPNAIHAWALPQASFTFSPEVLTIDAPTVQLIDQSTNATIWQWDHGTGADTLSTDPSHTFTFDSVACYTIQLTVISAHGCMDHTESGLCVEETFVLWVPNAFTPNGDDVNDTFGVLSSVQDPRVFELTLFDRWGSELYRTSSIEDHWDGNNAPLGVYQWKVRIRDSEGHMHEKFGHVTLLR